MHPVEKRDGEAIGQWRRPTNIAAQAKGSIHDDDVSAACVAARSLAPFT